MNKPMALLTVFLVVMIDLIGFGIVLPGLENYASDLNASPLFVGIIYSSYSLAQLIFSPLWGSLSDRIGRRPVMMASTLGAGAAYLWFAFSTSLGMLLFCRVFAGMMAGNISTAQAYVADVTDSKDRAKGMGLIGAAFGIGFVVGPALGGIIMKIFPLNPFYIIGVTAAGLSVLSFLLVVTRLPEPRRAVPTNANTGDRLIKTSIFTKNFWNYFRKINRESPGAFFKFLICIFLLTLGQASIYEAFPYFCRVHLGLPVAIVYHQYIWMGLVAVVIQGGLIRVLVKRFGERKLFLLGSLLTGVSLCVIPFTRNTHDLTAVMMLMAAGASLAVPTLTSLISKESSAENYGVTMGVSQSFSAMARAIGPTWGSLLLGISFRAPFVITGALVLLTIWVGHEKRA
ncbi:MAG: hypothetical protein AUJ71_04385 [Candidatus Omnitrophica bacterium CG1_02_49_16]|nr:MAG: hypothetical protein AUJ71_04385 [Candidatus Omnitrophica bacterium CG1_02_49_16]